METIERRMEPRTYDAPLAVSRCRRSRLGAPLEHGHHDDERDDEKRPDHEDGSPSDGFSAGSCGASAGGGGGSVGAWASDEFADATEPLVASACASTALPIIASTRTEDP
jgi:hypothetical protein